MKKINFGIALLLFGYNCIYASEGLGPMIGTMGVISTIVGILTSFSGFLEK